MKTLSLDALKAFEIDQVVSNNVIGGWKSKKSKKSKGHKGHSMSNSFGGGHYSAPSISAVSYHAPSISVASVASGGHYSCDWCGTGKGKGKKWKW